MNTAFIITVSILMLSGLTCKSGDPASPWEEPYDPYRPAIDGFTASRNSIPLADDIAFSGEDILLTVQATSQAFPESCGLDEGDVLEGNLIYIFHVLPPQGVDAEGFLTQATPPSNEAVWRIPDIDAFDTGEGIVYTLRVTVFDQCFATENTGSLAVRVFADQGPPLISTVTVESSVNASEPFTEEINKNGFYEVERSDKCRISISALKRSFDTICANAGIETGEELEYNWSSSLTDINLTFDEFPARAVQAEFDIPLTLIPGHTFLVECLVTDVCTDTSTMVAAAFIVVGAPRILGIEGSLTLGDLQFNTFFDTYEVLPGDEVLLEATGMVRDGGLCDIKGISPDLLWDWKETNNSIPVIVPEFDPIPVPNDVSRLEFVTPAALNGTRYDFLCTLTDRCNELTDTETVDFTVIVPPTAELTYVHMSTVEVELSIESGRYHVQRGVLLEIRVTGTSASETSFCETRGVSMDPPVQYGFYLPWEIDYPVLVYDRFPSTGYTDLELIIPVWSPLMDVNLRCRVRDLCNNIAVEIIIPFRIIA